jgi:hypothetical protein
LICKKILKVALRRDREEFFLSVGGGFVGVFARSGANAHSSELRWS